MAFKARVDKHKKRIRHRLLTAVLVVSVFGAGVVGVVYRHEIVEHVRVAVLTAGGAAVERIEVEGMGYTPKEVVLEAISLKKGDNLVPYNVSQARERLEALPWVRLATVEKKLPDTVHINLYEYKPIARVYEGDIWYVVSKDGVRIIEDTAGGFAFLPALSGVGAADNAVALLAQLQEYPALAAQLKRAHFVGERRWDFTFASGVLVRFPPENMSDAFEILKKLDVARHVLTLKGGVVDLRLPGKVTLKIPAELEQTPVL